MITVFTPTYNRAYILSNLFESLQNQTSKDFEWLIIDDGSTDETEKIVYQFQEKSTFKITYIYQKNSGKHVAINQGVKIANGFLFFIVDSDDFISKNAIEILINYYNQIKDQPEVAGIAIGCRSIKNDGEILYSKELPSHQILSNYNEIVYKYNIKGDFATAFKTEIQQLFPYPVFEGENFFRESLVYRRIGKKYKTLYVDDPIYYADYLGDGLTSKSWKMLKKSPKGAALFFKELSNEDIPLKDKLIALNAYWDFQLNDINSKWVFKFRGVNLLYSLIILINKKIKLINL